MKVLKINKKIKTQIEVDRRVWAPVKAYSTATGRNVNTAVEHLLAKALAMEKDDNYSVASARPLSSPSFFPKQNNEGADASR